jgi:hypothetical protein
LVRKPEGRTSFGRCRRRLEDYINVGLKEMGWDKWVDVANMVMNFLGSIKYGKFFN